MKRSYLRKDTWNEVGCFRIYVNEVGMITKVIDAEEGCPKAIYRYNSKTRCYDNIMPCTRAEYHKYGEIK